MERVLELQKGKVLSLEIRRMRIVANVVHVGALLRCYRNTLDFELISRPRNFHYFRTPK